MASSGDPKKRRAQSGRVTPKGDQPARAATSAPKSTAKPSSGKATDTGDAPERKVKKVPKPVRDEAPPVSRRYTPPSARADKMPSPWWVPALMFTFWGLGMLVIFLSYVGVLPGGGSNWYLLVGLGLILAGIITATQYR